MAKLVTTLGTTLLVAGAATTTTPASDTSERMLRQAMGYSQRGMHALEKGNAARAAEDFQRALKEVPELPDAHAGLGHVAMQQRRFEDALAAYRRAQQAYRNFAAQRVDLAQDRYSRSMDRIQYLQDEKGKLDREQRQAQVQGGPRVCEWDVFGEAVPFGSEERRMLHAERKICTPATADSPPIEVGRIVVHVLFDYLKAGQSAQEFLEDYPGPTMEQVEAVLTACQRLVDGGSLELLAA